MKRIYGYVKLDDKCSLMEDQPTPSQEPLAHNVTDPLVEDIEELVAALHEKNLVVKILLKTFKHPLHPPLKTRVW